MWHKPSLRFPNLFVYESKMPGTLMFTTPKTARLGSTKITSVDVTEAFTEPGSIYGCPLG